MTPGLLESEGAMAEKGRRERSRLDEAGWWERELSVGHVKFATRISHPGEMPGMAVSAACQMGGDGMPLLVHSQHPSQRLAPSRHQTKAG